jgi:hypothetical protein
LLPYRTCASDDEIESEFWMDRAAAGGA